MLACRHHVEEVHINHFEKDIGCKATVGPENPLFKLLHKQWHSIDTESCQLNKFERKSVYGSWLEAQAIEAKNQLMEIVKTKAFKNSEVSLKIS